MRVVYSLPFLLITVYSAIYFRLNTNQNTSLNVGDSLISTMGLFKATLLQNQCTLSIQQFNGNNAYTKVGNYTSSTFNGNCNSLVIQEGKVVTNNNFTYLEVGSSFNISTIMTIDDWGILRLVGTYQLPDFRNQQSFQINVTTFRKNHTYVYTGTQADINFAYQFGPIINQNNWGFSTDFGQFQIYQFDNPGLFVSYSYSSFKLNNSLIYDFPGNTFPATIFPNITFKPRCMEPRIYINFKAPYTLVIDQFWPVATVYEQGRYKVAQISYASVFHPQAWQNYRRLSFRQQHSVCPPFTFEFRGQCVTNCPAPYYYQLRGVFGDCVLTCEQYTPINDTTRVCSCYNPYEEPTISSLNIQTCPQNASTYPYGCYCTNQNQYFDRKYSFSCVSTCPQTTFASNGLCMQCPERCLSCQVDGLKRSYLECMACQSGYKVVAGQCYQVCSPGLGNSLVNGVCQPCSDPNCLDCSTNVGTCTRCNALYAVSNGACIQQCLTGTQMAPYQNVNTRCVVQDTTCSSSYASYYKNQSMLKCEVCVTNTYLHGGRCVVSCPTNFSANANNYCVCNNGTLTVNDKCLNVSACPIKMGWDQISSSCVSCQFGCMSCHNNWCTSCYPGYFLYLSPQGAFCRRKSPLYACDQQYGWINNACLLIQFNNPLYRLTGCLSSVANCQACFPGGSVFCASCQPGFYNFNNTCINTCPNGTIPYEGLTCLLTEIQNCSQPYFELPYQAVIVNFDKIQNSDPYSFWTFNGKAAPNDPVGYIPVFQDLTSRKTDGLFRNTQIYNPKWTCLKCLDGQGLSQDFSSCMPCPTGCLRCYMARNDSCLQRNTTVLGNCTDYVDYQTQQCISNCSSADYYPHVTNGILYCYPASMAPSTNLGNIDSSTYTQPDGTTQVFFVLDSNMQSHTPVTVPVTKSSGAPVVASNGDVRVAANTETVTVNNGFLHLQDTNTQNSVWIMNATGNVQKLASSSDVALSNTVYGVSTGQSHNTFMKTWLAYIGYIMGPVLICLHAVFIGNGLLYKVDNTLILAQALYFFSFIQLLVGKLLSQFYYGWLFAQFGFFPNFFQNTIPSNYVELDAPNSYKLATMDANIVRNAGWAFSVFLVFLGGWALITFICWLLKAACHKPDAWHPRIAVNSLIGAGQFLSFPVFFWSVANLMYIGNSDSLSVDFHNTSLAVSIFFIIFICIYGTGRWFFNVLGGLYMYKRIVIATILADAYLNNVMLAPLVIAEVVFCIVRYIVESPEKYKHIWMMVIQCLLHIAVYLLGFLSLSAGANTIIISLVIFIMIVIVAYGLTELYLESRNQWEVEDKDDFGSDNSMVRAEKRANDDDD